MLEQPPCVSIHVLLRRNTSEGELTLSYTSARPTQTLDNKTGNYDLTLVCSFRFYRVKQFILSRFSWNFFHSGESFLSL